MRLVPLLLLTLMGCSDAAAPPVESPADTTPESPSETPVPTPEPIDPTSLVGMFVGTSAFGFNTGAILPGATRPFGLVRLSPDTGDAEKGSSFGVFHAAGYRYEDPFVLGFSHYHLVGTGVADGGTLLVTPSVGDPAARTTWQGYRFPLDHGREAAEPGYYKLATDAFTAELTATERTGLHRYTFAPTDSALVVIDLGHALGSGTASGQATVDPVTGEVSGSIHNLGSLSDRYGGYTLYFVLRPSRVPASSHPFDSGLTLRFDATSDPVIELRVGISFVDVDGARENLVAEAGGFDVARAAAHDAWRKALGVVEVEGGTDTRRRLLYTALYHAQLMPTLLSDVDGRYRGLDQEVHTADGFSYYSDLSLWDTYRTLHPLATILFPDRQRDFLRSLERMAKDWGGLPRWPLATGECGSMVGTSADIVLGDSVSKGLTDFDVAATYDVARVTAVGPAPAGRTGRDGIEQYMALGYCPADQVGGSVAKTLEYSLDDYCLSKVAEHLGEDGDADLLGARGASWAHLFDPVQGFVAPKNADGSVPEYSPTMQSDFYVEGDAWQYLFMVPHDAPRLVSLLGGPEAFTAKLTTFMEGGRDLFDWMIPNAYYYHGNEPDIGAPALFAFGGRPDLGRKWMEWVADTAYSLEPGGLAGNDDGGTLSSWYVFAAAGLFPLPCTGGYVHTAPLFDRVVWHLPGGDLDVRRGVAGAAPTLGGAPIDGPTVAHDALVHGAMLVLPPAP